MRIVTNPGSNLPDEIVSAYGIVLAPQKFTVDGVEYESLDGVSLSQVDDWVKTAKVYPSVLGNSAGELVALFRELSRTDKELIFTMTSRYVIGTYTAACAASRILKERGMLDARIIDSGCTDLGIGLATIVAAEAARSGMAIDDAVTVVESFCKSSVFAFVPDTLEWLVKSGRATAIKAFFANWASLRPVIGFDNGELRTFGSVKRDETKVIEGLVDHAVQRIGEGRAVWIGVFHGNVPAKARRLELLLRRKFDVRYCLERPLHASIYLNAGPGTLGLYVAPIEKLPFAITPPPH